VVWDAKIEALRNAALEVLAIADKRTRRRSSKPAPTSTWLVRTAISNIGTLAIAPRRGDKRQRARFDPSAKKKKR